MDDITVEQQLVQEQFKHQLARLALGTIAGFLAGKAVEIVYNGAVAYNYNRTHSDITE